LERFSGSLADYRLQLVVPALFESEPATGVLALLRGRTQRTFTLEHGALIHERSSEPNEHLAQVLTNLGILDATRAAAAFGASHESSTTLGTFLVDRGFVDKARVVEALAHKAREALFDCYSWEAGEIEFSPGATDASTGVQLKLPLGALHRDAMARQAEWRVFREVFPDGNATFQVFREWAAVWGTEEEDALLALAERGATLSEMLASERGGSLLAARRLLQLYRRGVVTPRPAGGRRLGQAMAITHMLDAARDYLAKGEFENAAAVCAQALERAPVAEAQALYREAETRLGLIIDDEVLALEGRLLFNALPVPPPAELTADDLYLLSRLKGSPSVRQTLRSAPMGELAAFRCVRRLLGAGVVVLGPVRGEAVRRHKTDPFGLIAT
jgi:hypothetical protein